MKKAPRSKLAVIFYAFGILVLLSNAFPVFVMGMMGFSASGQGSNWARSLGFAGLNLLVQPVFIILFGGVVQILSDIRWALLKAEASENA